MFCYKCGHNLEESVEYCPKCWVYQKVNLSADDRPGATGDNSVLSMFGELSATKKAWSIAGFILAVVLLLSSIGGGSSVLNIFGNSTLNQSAANYILPGEASVTLQQVWGVELNGPNGPVSLRDMANQAFDYISYSAGGGITKSDVEIAFQPGNSMYSFFNRLLSSQKAIDAVKEQWISRSD